MFMVDVAHGGNLGSLQVIFELQQWRQVDKPSIGANVCTASSLGSLDQRAFIQVGHHRVAVGIRFEARCLASCVELRNGTSLQGAHAEKMNRCSLFGCLAACAHDIVFMVFAIGHDDHHGAGFAVFVECPHARGNGLAYGRALSGDHAGVHRAQKEFDGLDVGGQRTLDKRISRKHD